MRVAITGATGFIGGRLSRLLASQGHETIPVSRRLGLNVDDVDSLYRALKGCDAVAHCAGIHREIGDQTYGRVHVRGTENVVTASHWAGVRKITLMSFLRARPACGAPYHESKWAAEEIVRRSGLDITVLKAGVIYGPGDRLLSHLNRTLRGLPLVPLVGLRGRRLRPLAVDDMAKVLAASLVDPRLSGRTVAVMGPEEVSLEQMVRRVAAVVGRRPRFLRVPVRLHCLGSWALERTTRAPLVSLARATMLAEGLTEPATPADELPRDLQPRLELTPQRIRESLPEPPVPQRRGGGAEADPGRRGRVTAARL
jgi:NADH dehydrogenase